MIPATKGAGMLGALLFIALGSVPPSFSAQFEHVKGAPAAATAVTGCTQQNTGVREYAELIDKTRRERPELAEALRLFPKGGDLHNHLSGTVPPEAYLAMGTADGACFGPDGKTGGYTLATPPAPGACAPGFKQLAAAGEAEREKLLQSLSMYRFDYPDTQKGHDHFFAAFGRFRAVSDNDCNTPAMLAEALKRSHADGVSYLETMLSFQSGAVGRLAKLLQQRFPKPEEYKDTAKYPAMYQALLDAGLQDAVSAAQGDLTRYLNKTSVLLKCGAADQDPACGISYAFVTTVNRNSSLPDGTPDLAKVFTQAAFATLLSSTDSRVVGVNLLSGEDAAVSMGSFDTQMQIFGYFHAAFPKVNIALHAGEITPCFVGAGNPALKDHLTGSLKAGAKRIGHGVSFAYLTDAEKAEVAGLARRNGALVEIMFTSNAQILGVAGDAHPFMQYRRYGVPVAFATDDEGVSYASFTDQWIYGFVKYKLGWEELASLARNSLQYSFIPGAALWSVLPGGKVAEACSGDSPGAPVPSPACRTFLDQNPKAKAQWEYEARLAQYRQRYGKKYGEYFGRK